MIDPGQLSSAFLAGPELTAEQLDITNDRIAYFWWNPDTQEYLMATVSPIQLYNALIA